MEHKIMRPKDIIIENIIIKKKIGVGYNIYNYPLKYLNDSLIIQTPILTMPFGKYSYGSKSYIDASFINDSVDKDMANFKETITKINKLCIKQISKLNKRLKFVNCIKNSNDIYCDRIRLNIQEDILVFNEKRDIVSHEYLKAKAYVKFLISPCFIWQNEEKFGITWSILQAKVYPQTVLNTYSFLDDKEDKPIDSNIYKSHPMYKKYFKMVSCGVPKEAVKHKMVLDNLDPNVLDGKAPEKKVELNIELKTNSVNNNSNNIINKNNSNNNLNNKLNLNSALGNLFASRASNGSKINIVNEIKLAKTKKNEKKEKILKDVKETVGYKPPSLSQILEMRKKLNKVSNE